MKNLSAKFLAVLFLSLFTWACEDDTPDVRQTDQAVASDDVSQSKTTDNAKRDHNFLKNLKVDGVVEEGGTFKGKVTITEFGYDETTGLWVSGVIKGVATDADGKVTTIDQEFSNIPATLNETSSNARLAAQQQECPILFLDIGPIFLDLLGLEVDLSQIVLDITAVSGAGNLLGNLLCAVAGLLDPFGFLIDLINTLETLLDLLNQINDLIG